MTELESAKKLEQSYSCTVQDLEEKLSTIENSTRATIEKIRLTTQTIILKFQGFEQQLTAQVEDQGKVACEQLTESKARLQTQLAKHKETVSQVEHLICRSTAAELVQAQTLLNEHFHKLKDDLAQQNKGEETIDFDFVPNQSFLQSINSLGSRALGSFSDPTIASKCTCTVMGIQNATAGLEMRFEVVTRNSSGEQCYCPFDQITVNFFDIPTDLPVNIQDKKNGKYLVTFIPTAPGKMRVQVSVNNEHIKPPFVIKVKERRYQSAGATCADLGFHNPWGVAVNTSNEIFVTDMNNNRVKMFNENGDFVRSLGGIPLSSPSGICIDDSGRVYVVDRGNCRILLFNTEGEFLTEIGKGKGSAGQLKEPRGISLDALGNIILCNSGSRSVQLLSLQGDTLLTFEGRTCGLDFPFDCLYHNRRIYVSDFKSHSIKVFNNSGNFLFEFGRQGSGDGEFQNPTGLALDKAGNLLICDDYNHRVQVFTEEGVFITKFGSHGQELGQMDLPSGVAVLSDGRIVVAEFRNDRIQFFK